MIKRLFVITALVVVLAMPAVALAFGGFGSKSLCEFPFGSYGGASIYYDQRLYHPYYFEESYPNGGIKFELYLGGFISNEVRNALTEKIYWVRYTNIDKGSTYLLTKAYKYVWDGQPAAEYSIWLGHSSLVIGKWRMVVLTKFGRFVAYFEITQEMMDQKPAIAVKPYIYFSAGDPGEIEIWANHTNGDDYRFRRFDSDGNFIGPEERWEPEDECYEAVPVPTCQYEVMYPANGDLLRIETRIRNQGWLQLYPGPGCKADGMSPGKISRSLIWLKLDPPPMP